MWSLAMHELVNERQAHLRRDARRRRRELMASTSTLRIDRGWRNRLAKSRS